MPLTGTFDILDFSEVLRLLARQALTGRLHLRSRAFNANLFFEDGQIVGADQADHQAAATAGDVRGRLEEICFEMLEAERGSFEFQPGKTAIMPGDTRLKVETVISRARKRLQEWHELQTVIPSMDLAPQLVIDLEQAEITIDRETWRLLTAVDGRRTLRAIGRLLDMSDFDACRVVRVLLEAGIVQLDERAAALAFAMGPDAEGPPVTEKVTTVHGKQAVRATTPTAAGERTRARIEAARRAALVQRAARSDDTEDDGDDDGAGGGYEVEAGEGGAGDGDEVEAGTGGEGGEQPGGVQDVEGRLAGVSTPEDETPGGEDGQGSRLATAPEPGELAGGGQPVASAMTADADAGTGGNGSAPGAGGGDGSGSAPGAGGSGGASQGGSTTGAGSTGTEGGALATGEIPAASLPGRAPPAAADRLSRPRRVVRIRSKLPKRPADG
ncbi:MAG TPA: DUF4388 domain-containing protein [Acidimicrobiales bacterium]|nr:DUF4388 domain-containing protein [Acidimicrobiales bacterium]